MDKKCMSNIHQTNNRCLSESQTDISCLSGMELGQTLSLPNIQVLNERLTCPTKSNSCGCSSRVSTENGVIHARVGAEMREHKFPNIGWSRGPGYASVS